MALKPEYKSQDARPGQTAPRQKILRVGVFLAGNFVEERQIREREDLTIGQSAKNTFSIPIPELPKAWPLFQVREGKYWLNVSDAMDGRLGEGAQVLLLSQVKSSGKAQKQGTGWLVPLSESARGKVVLGDLTLLFQFVFAPPLQPKPQLPHSVRGRLADRIDPWMTLILAMSLLVHGGTAAYVYRMDVPRRPEPDEIPDNFPIVKRRAPPKEEPKAQAKAEPQPGPPAEVTGTPQAKPASGGNRRPGQGDRKSEEEISAERDAARAAKKEQAASFFSAVTRAGSGGGRHTSANTMTGDLERKVAASAAEGRQVSVGGGGGPRRPGGSTLGTGTGGERVGGGGGREDGATAVVSDRPKLPNVKTKKPIAVPGSSGKLDPEHVYGKINGQYAGGVRKCYEDALKSNSALGGAVAVTFKVGSTGSVVSVETKGFDGGVDACIKNKARGWTFNAPKEGEVTFRITFDLTPAGQ